MIETEIRMLQENKDEKNNKDFNRNPNGSNQWILRSNEEIQK